MALDTKDRVETPEGQATDDAFNDLWNHPDNDDLRDNLNAVERNPDGAGKDAANENLMNYMQDNVSMADKPFGNKFRSWLGRNKWSVAGGGSAIILLGGLFSIAAPMKLQGIIESITGVGMGRVEHYVEKRTMKILSQSILQRFGVGERNLVKHGSLVERLAKTMAANKYEEHLAKKGILFAKDGDKVKITLTGENIDEAKRLLGRFSDADDLAKVLEDNAVTKKIMKSIIKEDLGVWGFLVRGKMTRWMMSYLGIKRFGTAKTDENATPEQKAQTAALDDVADSVEAQSRAIDQAVDVMDAAEKTGSQADEVASDAGKAAAKQGAKDLVTETADTVTRTAIKEATGGGSAITRAVLAVGEKLGLKISEELAKKIGTKAIPVYGWVVLGATAVVFAHWIYKNPDKATRAIATPAALLMGNIYAKWGGIATQGKLGTLDKDLYNYYTPFLDGVETSSLFNCVDTNWATGCDNTGTPAYKKLNETSPDAVNKIFDTIANNSLLKLGADWYLGDFSPNYLLSRLIYNIDDLIMGLAMNVIVDKIKSDLGVVDFFAKLALGDAKVKEIKDNAEKMLNGVAQFGMETMLNIFGLNVSMLSGGNQLYDITLNGSVYAGNRYAETSLGLHKIDLATASVQMQQYIAEQTDYDKSKGIMYALFSPDASKSVTSNLISRTSFGGGTVGTASNMVSSLFGLVRSTPSSLAGIVTNRASAGSFTSPEAVVNAVPIGMTTAEEDAPVSPNLSSGEACPGNDIGDSVAAWFGIDTKEYDGNFDSCKIDTAVGDSIYCSMESTVRETPECNPDAGGNSAGSTSVSGTCPANTTVDYGMQDGYDNSTVPTKIHTCGIKDWPSNFANSAGENLVEVNAAIAEDTVKLAAALKADSAAHSNYDFAASLGFRTFAQQQCLYDYAKTGNKGCSDYTTQPKVVARPGYSNHQMGYSIDLESGYSCKSPSYTKNPEANRWLDANMKTYGFSRDVGCSDYGHFTHAH